MDTPEMGDHYPDNSGRNIPDFLGFKKTNLFITGRWDMRKQEKVSFDTRSCSLSSPDNQNGSGLEIVSSSYGKSDIPLSSLNRIKP